MYVEIYFLYSSLLKIIVVLLKVIDMVKEDIQRNKQKSQGARGKTSYKVY